MEFCFRLNPLRLINAPKTSIFINGLDSYMFVPQEIHLDRIMGHLNRQQNCDKMAILQKRLMSLDR